MEVTATRRHPRPNQKAVISAASLRRELAQVGSLEEAYRKFALAAGYKFYVDRDTGRVFAGKISPQAVNAMRRVEAAQEQLRQLRDARRARDRARYRERVEQRAARGARPEGRRQARKKLVVAQVRVYIPKHHDGENRHGTAVHLPEYQYMSQGVEHDEYVCISDKIRLNVRKDRYTRLFGEYPVDTNDAWMNRIGDNEEAYKRATLGLGDFMQALENFNSPASVIEINAESELLLATLPPAEQRAFSFDRRAMLCSRFTYPQIADGHALETVLKVQQWSEFVEEHSRPLSCLFDVILDTYKDAIEASGRAKNWLKKHQLSYERLIPGREEAGPLQLTDAVEHFFRPMRLGLCVFNVFGRVEFSYHPEMDGYEVSRNIAPQTLYLLAHENHVWRARNPASLAQRMKWDPEIERYESLPHDIPLSDKFPKVQPQGQYEDCRLLRSVDELPALIRRFAEDDAPKLRLYWADPCLAPLLHHLVADMNLTPHVQMRGQAITSIRVEFDANPAASLSKTTKGANEQAKLRSLTIESYNSQNDESNQSGIRLDSDQELRLYLAFRDELNTMVMSRNHKSYYGPGVMEAFQEYPRKALLGVFGDGQVHEVDFRRFYTSILESMEGLPVLNQFDVFRPCADDGPIDPHSFYIVDCGSDLTKKFPFVYDRARCLVRGSTLEKFPGPVRRAVLRPSNVVRPGSSIRDIIERLYASPLPDAVKKVIPNTLTGMLEKVRNRKQQTYLYRDATYAMDVRERLGDGMMMPLCEGVWGLMLERARDLVNGFYPIKRCIYEEARVRMQDVYTSLQEARIPVLGVRTDAVYTRVQDEARVRAWMAREAHRFGPERGKLSVKFGAVKKLQVTPLSAFRIRTEIDGTPSGTIRPRPRDVHTMQDEWDQEEFNRFFDAHPEPILLTACLPGSGKSVCIQRYIEARGLKALYVCSDNALISELQKDGRQAVTVNRFFGFGVEEDQQMTAADISQYNAIVFEEVYKCTTSSLGRIHEFIQQHPDLRVFANGDPRQNLPIECINHIPDPAAYYDACMSMLFRRSVHLRHMKSMTDPADRATIARIYEDLFERKLVPKLVVTKYFAEHMMKWADIPTEAMNVVYLNETSDLVNGTIQSRVGSMAWQVGDLAICRGHVEAKNRPVKNELYRITALTENLVTVCSTVTGKTLELARRYLYAAFKRSFAATGHSVQGRRFDQQIVIHDWSHPLITPEWLWTAITRARGLRQIRFCADSKGRYDFLAHIARKITGYKEQDQQRFGAVQTADYVDGGWVRQKLADSKMCCYHCHAFLAERWVLDRMDANLPHTKTNCVVACESCNWSKARSEHKRQSPL